MALACGQAQSTYSCLFDSSTLLTKGPDALRMYHFQTLHHRLALATKGLPQEMVSSVLLHVALEVFLDLFEQGDNAPALVIIWA